MKKSTRMNKILKIIALTIAMLFVYKIFVIIHGSLKSLKVENLGNTMFNINDDGWVSEDKNSIYFSNSKDGGKLYKSDKNFITMTRLTSKSVNNINVTDKYVYFICGFPGELYRVNKNLALGVSKKIINFDVSQTLVTDNYIFYRRFIDKNPTLYRCDLNGNNHIKLAENVSNYTIHNNQIYYINIQDRKVYKTNLKGEGITNVINQKCTDVGLVDNTIYYIKETDLNLYAISNNKKERTITQNCGVECLNIYNNYIFYRNKKDGGAIYRVDLDGSNNKKIVDGNNTLINIVNNKIFFRRVDINSGFFMFDLDSLTESKLS